MGAEQEQAVVTAEMEQWLSEFYQAFDMGATSSGLNWASAMAGALYNFALLLDARPALAQAIAERLKAMDRPHGNRLYV